MRVYELIDRLNQMNQTGEVSICLCEEYNGSHEPEKGRVITAINQGSGMFTSLVGMPRMVAICARKGTAMELIEGPGHLDKKVIEVE